MGLKLKLPTKRKEPASEAPPKAEPLAEIVIRAHKHGAEIFHGKDGIPYRPQFTMLVGLLRGEYEGDDFKFACGTEEIIVHTPDGFLTKHTPKLLKRLAYLVGVAMEQKATILIEE